MKRHKVNVSFFNWLVILLWWVMLMLTCWIICF